MSKWNAWLKTRLQTLRERMASRGYSCEICGAELFSYPTPRICSSCDDLLLKNDKNTCPKCGRAVVSQGVCLACKSRLPHFTRAVSVFSYEGLAARTVNGLKNGKRHLSWYLGEALAKKIIDSFSLQALQENEWLLIPIPLTATRQKERGYNQAEELALAVRSALQKAGANVELDTEALIKRRDEHMQKHLSSQERFENAEGAYHVHKRKLCRGKNILLIDDVITTGATGSACAKLLLGAGANAVYLCTVAATPEKK